MFTFLVFKPDMRLQNEQFILMFHKIFQISIYYFQSINQRIIAQTAKKLQIMNCWDEAKKQNRISFIIIEQKRRSKMVIILIKWVIMLMIWKQGTCNLLCNGDFEQYKLTTFVTFNNILYGTNTFSSNTSCWYSNRAKFQVQKTSYGTGTQCVELSYMFGYYELCQNVTLVSGQLYKLEYDVSLLPQVTSVTAYTFLNGKSLINITNNNYSTVVHGQVQFTTNITNNKICTNGTADVPAGVSQLLELYTPLLDNFNLVLMTNSTNDNTSNTTSNIKNNNNDTNNYAVNNTNNDTSVSNNNFNTSNETTNVDGVWGYNGTTQYNISGGGSPTLYLNIEFFKSTDDIQGIIYLNSTTLMSKSVLVEVEKSLKIYIEGELQTNTLYYLNEYSCICITIYCQRSYDLRTVFLTFPPQVKLINGIIYLFITINGQQFLIYSLPPQLAKIVSDAQPLSTSVLEVITKGYNILRTFFFSYFLVNLINFFTLTLMYNFLNIATQPNFSHNFLQKLAQIIYLQNSLSGTIKKIFINSKYQNIINFTNNVQSPQKIKMFYGVYAWFGKMGLTYNYLSNNFQTIIILLLAITKLILLKIVMSFLPKISTFFFGKEINSFKLFVIDFISVTPILTVSAFCSILNFGDAIFKQRINSILQIITLFIIILQPFFYFILQVQSVERKYESKQFETNKQKKKSIKKMQIKIKQALFQFLKFSLNIIIPLLVVLSNNIAFFIVISIIILLVWSLYINIFKHLSYYQRLINGLEIFILLVHHLIFLFMYIAEFLKISTNLINCLMICGLIIIFTVICGGALELIDFFLCSIYTFLSMIAKFCKIQFWKKTRNSNQLEKQIPTVKRKRNHIDNLTGLGNVMYIKAQKIRQIKKVFQHKNRISKISKKLSINLNELKQIQSPIENTNVIKYRVSKSNTLNNSLNIKNKTQISGNQSQRKSQKVEVNEILKLNSPKNEERGSSQLIKRKAKKSRSKGEGSIMIVLRQKNKAMNNGNQRW